MKSLRTRLNTRHKNNRFVYYLRAITRQFIPGILLQSTLTRKLGDLKDVDLDYILKRVNHYNKLSQNTELPASSVLLKDFKFPKRQKTYYFDTQEYTRYFNLKLRISYLFGDVTRVPDSPAIVKSRPITPNNTNSVVLKLDKLRHFMFVHDVKSFEIKKNLLIGRCVVRREHRRRFYELYFNHPMCNLGETNSAADRHQHWVKDYLTIDEHLDYKFILCLEGNDVASNLKWVMSSNSLAVMPKPKFETWFMEETLIPNYHYMLIKDDYSDLEERMNYYIQHPQEALQIINNAHAYVEQFKNKKQEDLISLLVLEKYFYKTGQLTPENPTLYD
jgi:hypothetical protein